MKYKNIYSPVSTLLFGVTRDSFVLKNGVSSDTSRDMYKPDRSMDILLSWVSILMVSVVLAVAIILLLRRVSRTKVVSRNIKKLPRITRRKKIAALVVIIGILGFLAVPTLIREILWPSYALAGPTYVVRGQVTQKRTSCGLEVLGADGKARQEPGGCDGGNNLMVGELSISTGGGSNGARRVRYTSDIESIHAGDRVEIRYAKHDRFGYSTNCRICYVKKL